MTIQAESYHIPVLLEESVDGMRISDGAYVDLTFGGGGHSREILGRMSAKSRLYSFDQDADAEGNIIADDRFTFVRSNFRYLKNWMRYYGEDGVDAILADLGVSSHHFETPERGFSFRFDTPLDMRMNRRSGKTASDILNDYDEESLWKIFSLYGELKDARRIARRIKQAACGDWTTGRLVKEALGAEELSPNQKKDAARLFQALRIEVNHEMDALSQMLTAAVEVLKPGGRLVVITYHSLEDRMVKNIMKAGNIEGRIEQDFFGRRQQVLKEVCKMITPSNEEIERNPRSRSAKLRIAEKIAQK